MGDLIKIGEVSEILHVTPQTVRNYEFAGILLPDTRTSGGTRLYDRDRVEKFFKEKYLVAEED